jgi:hypothetical protein
MNLLRYVMQRPYQAERNPLSRIDLRGGDICLGLMAALSSPLPNLPRMGVGLARTMLSPF